MKELHLGTIKQLATAKTQHRHEKEGYTVIRRQQTKKYPKIHFTRLVIHQFPRLIR